MCPELMAGGSRAWGGRRSNRAGAHAALHAAEHAQAAWYTSLLKDCVRFKENNGTHPHLDFGNSEYRMKDSAATLRAYAPLMRPELMAYRGRTREYQN